MIDNAPEGETERGRLYYGYIIVFSCFIIMVMTFGINYSFGVFFKPLLTEFGWTRATTSGAYSVMTVFAGFFGIFAGRLGDFLGPKVIGILTGLFLSMGLLLLSQTQNIWHFYLSYGVVTAAGVGGCWPGLIPAVTKWFTTRRGLMTGIVTSGIGFGTMIIPSVAEWLISVYEWRTAYIVIGIITLVLVIGVSQFLKPSPQQTDPLLIGEWEVDEVNRYPENSGHNFKEAAQTRPFWLLCAIYFCFGFCLHSIMVHIAPHAQDLGISSDRAAKILAIIGATSIFARILIAGASDRFGVKPSLIAAFSIMLLSVLWVQVAREWWMFCFFAVIFGTAYGAVALQALAAAELFGLRSLGVIIGAIAFVYTIGGATGPVFCGYFFDRSGSYTQAFWVVVAVAVLALILTLLLKLNGKEQQAV